MTIKNNLFLKLKNFLSGNLSIIFCYLLLALFFTFPLILNLKNSLPAGNEDPLYVNWYFWFFKFNLIDLHLNPFLQSDLIFYPVGFNISTGYDFLLITIISLPLQLIFKNLFVIYNIIIIINFIFSSYAAYHLIKYLTNDRKISFIAGIIFGFSPYMLARGLVHINLLTTGMIPLFILLFLKLLKDPSFKNSFLLALSFLLVCLSCWQYGLFTLLFVFFSLILLYFISKKIILNKQYLKNFVRFLILSAFFVLPFAFPMILGRANDKMSFPSTGDAVAFSADIFSYLTPSPSHTLYGKFINNNFFLSVNSGYPESTNYLGLLEIIFIIYFFFLIVKKNKLKKIIIENIYWIITAFIFFILSLGPLLKIGGYVFQFILPYYFIFYLPFFDFAKEPSRLGIFVMLFITIILSIFLKEYLDQKKTQKNIILLFIALIIIAERITLPYQIKKIEIPVFYNQIAKEKNDYAILDLPANIKWSQQPLYNFYQTIHSKKIIMGTIGYTSFSPNIYSWIRQNNFTNESNCHYSNKKEKLADTIYEKDQIMRIFKNAKIKYVIIHKNIISNLENYGFDCQKVKNNTDKLFKNDTPIFEDELIRVYNITEIL